MKNVAQRLLESITITLLYILIGFYFFPSDPLLIDSKIPLIVILLTIITLFHGTKYGLVALSLLGSVSYFLYHPYPIVQLLSYLILVLILGQFYHYWFKTRESMQAVATYTQRRLNELNHAFYTLKLSHDTMKNSYVLKSMSMRSAFEEIQNFYAKDGSHYQRFLHLLTHAYRVEDGTIALLKDDDYYIVASIKKESTLDSIKQQTLDLDDPLIQHTLESGETSYVSQLDDKKTPYLAVIPMTNQNRTVTALLTIEKMPFLEFNDDNMIAISILFSYFIDQVTLHTRMSQHNMRREQLFAYRFNELYSLKKRYNIDSTMIILKIDDELILKRVKEVLEGSLRALDEYQVSKEPNQFIVFILLPLTPIDSSIVIVDKLKQALMHKKFEYMGFEIQQKPLMLRYIEES